MISLDQSIDLMKDCAHPAWGDDVVAHAPRAVKTAVVLERVSKVYSDLVHQPSSSSQYMAGLVAAENRFPGEKRVDSSPARVSLSDLAPEHSAGGPQDV